jgi:hypothetical protein
MGHRAKLTRIATTVVVTALVTLGPVTTAMAGVTYTGAS